MFSVFLELVKRVGIFVIIGQTMIHFGISKEYEKYTRLVVSLMVAAQIVFAFHSYLRKEEWDGRIMFSEKYYEQWDENMKELEEEFIGRQEEVKQNLEKRFQVKEGMGETEGYSSINEIKIEKIIIQ